MVRGITAYRLQGWCIKTMQVLGCLGMVARHSVQLVSRTNRYLLHYYYCAIAVVQ